MLTDLLFRNAGSSAMESIQGTGATAQKEGNKEVAKDSNQGIGERATAAKDAVGNKMDETKHETKSEADKQAAKN
ncbi:MAG: hypothetical protein L6R42_004016 [Xanthoria sp. 1 TBL-2021]|nr:MAG: hypothetical protein L6R42_004016 [Xanthoria sp. 1 TBL-2021]